MLVKNSVDTNIIIPKETGEQLFAPGELFLTIQNFYFTSRGTLRAVQGPAVYTLSSTFGINPYSAAQAVISGVQNFGLFRGIFHGYINADQREVLLIHTGDQIWSYIGATRLWVKLIGPFVPASGAGDIDAAMTNDTLCRLPTQFIQTTNGVIIVCESKRAYFYDGLQVAPLGFDTIPGAPSGLGPQNSRQEYVTAAGTFQMGINDAGYAYDALTGVLTGMDRSFKICRKGTIQHAGNADAVYGATDRPSNNNIVTGWLNPGAYRAKLAYVDNWGNISAWSSASNEVRFARQPSAGNDGLGARSLPSDMVRKQIAWSGLALGPDYTAGRLLAVTKDTENSGTAKFFIHTQNSDGGSGTFATIADNTTTIYPDNIPDAWLATPISEYMPVPLFNIGCIAFGRLWIGDIPGNPSFIYYSDVGFWGTFPLNRGIAPDPRSSRITGLVAINEGLLAMTENSTFIVTAVSNDLFQSRVLSSLSGCVSHDSIKTLPWGVTIWLGHDGFYRFDGKSVARIAESMQLYTERINYARARQACSVYDPTNREYICYVPYDGSAENTMGFVFSELGVRLRNDMQPVAMCVTQDALKNLLALGRHDNFHAVFVMNKSAQNYRPTLSLKTRQYIAESGWISLNADKQFAQYYKVQIWCVETANGSITVELYKNWRNSVDTTDTTILKYSPGDVPQFWDTAIFGTGNWVKTRPFWTVVNFYVPATEAFKFKISGTEDFEIIGVRIIGADKSENDTTVQNA